MFSYGEIRDKENGHLEHWAQDPFTWLEETGFIRASPPVTIVTASTTQHFSTFLNFQVVSAENKEHTQ